MQPTDEELNLSMTNILSRSRCVNALNKRNEGRLTRGMLAVTQQDLGNQIYAHHWIYNPILRKVHGCSLDDGTWVMCSMTAGLEHLSLPNDQRLNVSGFSHGEQQFLGVTTYPDTWHRYHYMLVVSFASAGHNTPFSKISLFVLSIWI
jgi:hypothetical protein